MYGRLRALCGVAVLIGLHAPPAHAQEVDPAIATLLEYSEVENILGGVREDIRGILLSLSVEPSPEQEAVLSRVLAVEALAPMMEQELEDLGESKIRAAAAELIEEGAIARIRSLAEAQPPATTIEEYVTGLQSDPPPRSRIELISRVAEAQSAGAFYVLLDERTREAAHMIAEALGSSVEPFAPISEGQWVARAAQGHGAAVVWFLYRYQSVPDDLLRASLDDWSSEAGAWFVEAYSLALGETLLAAADTVSTAMHRR
jgi:hypothetical protein